MIIKTAKYEEYESPYKYFIKTLIKEMEGYSKEELEGVIRCIENDPNVTYAEGGRGKSFRTVIHGDAAILIYIKAYNLLERIRMK